MRYSTDDTLICAEENQEGISPFPRTADDETTTASHRPGGKIVRNYHKMVKALTKTVSSFELSRHIYG
jgi:hypothetical protein